MNHKAIELGATAYTVVDAGGKGYVFILEATLSVLRGEAFVPAEAPAENEAEDVYKRQL